MFFHLLTMTANSFWFYLKRRRIFPHLRVFKIERVPQQILFLNHLHKNPQALEIKVPYFHQSPCPIYHYRYAVYVHCVRNHNVQYIFSQ